MPDITALRNVGHEQHVPDLHDLTYLGTAAFNGAAETVRFKIDVSNNQTLIQLDMNGDTTADMEIELTGIKILAADDFLL